MSIQILLLHRNFGENKLKAFIFEICRPNPCGSSALSLITSIQKEILAPAAEVHARLMSESKCASIDGFDDSFSQKYIRYFHV